VVLDVEDAFDIEIDNESMEKMLNVSNAIEIIEQKLG
jgi:acyl carrier protein